MPDEEIDELQRYLKRSVDPEERHSVPSLDRLSGDHIAEARAVRARHGLAVVHYLRFLVAAATLRDVVAFIEDVLEKGNPVTTWKTGPTLFLPSVRQSELLELSTATFEDLLASVDGVRWRCLAPTVSPLRWTSAPGEPGVLVPDGNHTIRAPEGTEGLVLGAASRDVVEVLDLTTGVRRWVASQMARQLSDTHRDMPESGDDVLRTLGSIASASDDARVAARALVRESSLPGNHEVPLGYRGPDDWYT